MLNQCTGGLGDSQTTLYADLQSWQTLQDPGPDSDRHSAPLRRPTGAPLRWVSAAIVAWIRASAGSCNQFNRFTHPDENRCRANRLHAVRAGGAILRHTAPDAPPRLVPAQHQLIWISLQAAHAASLASIPTFSVGRPHRAGTPGREFVRTPAHANPGTTCALYCARPSLTRSMPPLFDSAPARLQPIRHLQRQRLHRRGPHSDANEITMKGATSRLLDERGDTAAPGHRAEVPLVGPAPELT